MYTPHTVTIVNSSENPLTLEMDYNITILYGVFLDMSKADNVKASGLENADSVTLFIPFDVDAKTATGGKKTYLPPKEYAKVVDHSLYWTLNPGGDASSVSTFFVKGIVDSVSSYKELKQTYDYVFDVTAVDIRDFGSKHMQHFQVSGR